MYTTLCLLILASTCIMVASPKGFCTVRIKDGKLVSKGDCEKPNDVIQELNAMLKAIAHSPCQKCVEFLKAIADLKSSSKGNWEDICVCNGTATWMVFQRRVPKDGTSFNGSFDLYKSGFGNRNASFWLGLDALHLITSTYTNLTVNIIVNTSSGNHFEFSGKYFQVGNNEDNYKISWNNESEPEQLMTKVNGKGFQVISFGTPCTNSHGTGQYGWWYYGANAVEKCNPNGPISHDIVQWRSGDKNYKCTRTEMRLAIP